jgi:hypothetical protein
MSVNENAVAVIHRMVQEDSAQPGAGLSYMKAILYFGIIPLGIFLGITGLVLLLTSDKKSNSQISSID